MGINLPDKFQFDALEEWTMPGVSCGVHDEQTQHLPGYSAYAWFVAAGTVKAEGMQVQAQSDGGLVIRYHGGNWGTSATAGMTAARELKPASTVNLSTWYTATAMDPDDETANLDTVSPISDVMKYATDKDDSDSESACHESPYALVKYFEIRSATAQNAPMGLKIDSIGINYNDSASINFQKNMSTALRIGIQCMYKADAQATGYTTVNHIYAPVTKPNNTPTTTYHYIESYVVDASAGTSAYRYSDDTDKGGNASAVFSVNNAGDAIVPQTVTLTSDPVKVYIYVWFEGEDGNLYSSNFNTEALSVSVNFTSIAKAST